MISKLDEGVDHSGRSSVPPVPCQERVSRETYIRPSIHCRGRRALRTTKGATDTAIPRIRTNDAGSGVAVDAGVTITLSKPTSNDWFTENWSVTDESVATKVICSVTQFFQ